MGEKHTLPFTQYSHCVSYPVIMDCVFTKYVDANLTILVFQILILTAEGDIGTYWLHLCRPASRQSSLRTWNLKSVPMESTSECRGYLEHCCVSSRFEKQEFDSLQHISSWKPGKLTVRNLVVVRRVKTFTISCTAILYPLCNDPSI